MSILDDLKAIRAEAEEGLKNAGSLEALEQIRIAVTGKKGSLTAAMKGMGKLAPEERPQVGKLANEVRASENLPPDKYGDQLMASRDLIPLSISVERPEMLLGSQAAQQQEE